MIDRCRWFRAHLIPLLGTGSIALGLIAWGAALPEAAPPAANEAARMFEPAAPILPAEIIAALQDHRYPDATKALDALAAQPKAKPSEIAYYGLISGIARRSQGELDAARTALEAAQKADPQGPWGVKLRSELTAVELAAGRFAQAEALARAEAESLLDHSRKDRLARVYQTFADKLAKPNDPVIAPDPEGAHALREQGRALAKGDALRAVMLLAMARDSQAAGNHARAIGEFQSYLSEYAKADVDPADMDAARFGLGESQLAAGQPLPARLSWDDLIRHPKAKEKTDYVARAMYQVSRTYGVPNPPDDTQLNLGVAALKRFLAAYPAHALAIPAMHEIALSYLARGRSQQALEALHAFLDAKFEPTTDEARRDLAERRMTATFQVAQVLQSQLEFDKAIAAFQGYLAQFPNGPQSADAQRSILDTKLAQANDHERNGRHKEARAAWQAFAAQNPLDARVPDVLYLVGASFYAEKPPQVEEAIAAWDLLAAKFPNTGPAGHAQFDAAALVETAKGGPAAAIDRFKKIEAQPWKNQALQRVSVMESKALTVVTPRAFRSGEKPQLKITTRNLEKLTFTAYKIDPEAYFRKKHALAGVEALDIGLVAADAEWNAPVPDYAKYKPIETTYELKVEVPGVYVVKVTDEKTLQATTLVLGSDIDAIVKASRDQVLVFAQDMKTGKGRPKARVLVAQGDEVLLDAQAGDDGVLLKNWDKPRDPKAALSYLVLDGAHAAGSGLGVPEQVAQGLSPRAYLYTERPAYRPGQTVHLRGVVREVKDSQYLAPAKETYKLEVIDSRGRPFLTQPVVLSEFGTLAADFTLDAGAPVGTYRVRAYQPGKSDFSGQFEVQAYQLQKVELKFDLPRTVYYRGETVKGSVIARYQYGTPLAGRPITLALPDGRNIAGATDDTGKYAFEFPTEGYGEAQALRVVAALPQDNVNAAARVIVAVLGFDIGLKTPRSVYLDGEKFAVAVSTNDASGKPIGEELTVSVLKQVKKPGTNIVSEVEVSKLAAKTDPKTGAVSVPLVVEDKDGGSFIVRAAGTDQFGNPIITSHALTISGAKDEVKLRILADRQRFKVGEKAAARLINRGPAGTVLLTWEADRILKYELAPMVEGENSLAWAVDGAQFPNFTLTASRMAETKFHQARMDIEVERDLTVTIKPTKEAVGPGDPVEIEVTTTDQLGNPVPAEVSVALVDQALLRLYQSSMPAIGDFFHDQQRKGAFSTEATNTFTYKPATVPVPTAVVEEADRVAAVAADVRKQAEVATRAMSQVMGRSSGPAGGAGGMAGMSEAALAAPPAPAPTSAAAEMPALADAFAANQPSAEGLIANGEMSDLSLGLELKPGESGAKRLPASGGRLRAGVVAGKPAAKAKAPARRKLAEAAQDGVDKWADVKDFDEADEKEAAGNFAYFARSDSASESRAKGQAAASPRQAFVETAYWNPHVVTGKDGKTKVTFTAPMALSRYEFSARGVTGSDTLVGQANADLQVKKNFFIDLKQPAMLTQGDRPRFSARLHHVGATGQASVTLKAYAGGREQVFPKTIDIKADGVEDLLFEPFEVPDGDVARLTISAKLNDATDEVVSEVPIQPWGVQAYATASGTASSSTTALVSLGAGRAYESPEMLIVLSPTVRRMLFELALGRDAYPLATRNLSICLPIPPDTTTDRASDLLAAASALSYLRTTKALDAPEASRLTDRARGLAAELLTLQNDDGGWPWAVGATTGKDKRPSERLASARVFWALATIEPLGLLADVGALDRGANYLTQAFAQADPADHETRAVVLHALSTRNKATFEQANAINRVRDSLSDAALGYLALTFANLQRVPLANEVLTVLAPRAKHETVAPGTPDRIYWDGASRHPGLSGSIEATALAADAFAKARPNAPELAGAVNYLLAHRIGSGWAPTKAKGPALSALASFYGKAQTAEDRYSLSVKVNDQEVHHADVTGSAEGRVISVPRAIIKPTGVNRVVFTIDGRATLGYAVTLTGFTRDFAPDQNAANRNAVLYRHVYTPADPEFEGKPLPTGFGVAVGATGFENTLSQLPLGGRARIKIGAYRVVPPGQPAWERDFLVIEEHVPAGATLVDGSVQTSAGHWTLADDTLTFYFAPDQEPGETSYDVYGYLPGQYRALPPVIHSAYELGRRHLGPAGEIRVLAPGEASTDPYKPTPDELYARGKALFDAGRLAEAAAPLEALWGAYTLRDDVAKDAARMLLYIHMDKYEPRKIVQYFEVLRDKAPELVVPFDKLLIIGRAYRDLGEFERAVIVWRGTVEASYLEDARLGELLRQRGQQLEAVAFLIGLWREYPNTAAIESDFFGLSQLVGSLAGKATTDPALRKELAEVSKARSDLLLQQIRLIQVFLSQSPANPMADEASLALVGAFLDLENYDAVVKLAERYAALYPKSTFLDSFQYSAALGLFHLGQYDRAIAIADKIAKASYKDANGVDQPSPNKWQAIYIIGQIHDARGQYAQAVESYKQVTEQFTDAAEAVKDYTHKELSLPEVTVVRPAQAKPADAKAEAEKKEAKPADPKAEGENEVKLTYRNIAEIDVKVYPVDLMRLYLTRRNLAGIAGIDLAGIRPLVEKTIKLGDGQDFANKTKVLDLPLTKEGAYLVMVRGENLYASGIALVSPLNVEVIEEPGNGRVRVTVRDAASKAPVPKALVKVIGTGNGEFLSGETDLRGVYIAEGVQGQVTAVTRLDVADHKDAPQYAFHRGTVSVGAPPPPAVAQPAAPAPAEAKKAELQQAGGGQQGAQSLEQNVKQLNTSNQMRQIERLQERYQAKPSGGAELKGFK